MEIEGPHQSQASIHFFSRVCSLMGLCATAPLISSKTKNGASMQPVVYFFAPTAISERRRGTLQIKEGLQLVAKLTFFFFPVYHIARELRRTSTEQSPRSPERNVFRRLYGDFAYRAWTSYYCRVGAAGHGIAAGCAGTGP